ncbi:MAG: hypothetical protein PHX08_15175 [Lachnospiraceae bacterium]|nr:hypothetical protein [Lachnospiraceae bacterium]
MKDLKEQFNYLVIGYYKKKAIIKDQGNQLYFLNCAEKEAPIGMALEKEYLQSIEKLGTKEQEIIHHIYGKKDD